MTVARIPPSPPQIFTYQNANKNADFRVVFHNRYTGTAATENWNVHTSGTEDLRSIFGTSDGERLWAVAEKGTILEAGLP
jgi:hypothetical protein